MPITKSAKKALRQSKKRRSRNILRKKAIRIAAKEALSAPSDKQMLAIAKAYKAIDKAAKRGVIKKNTAARKKSRLIKALKRSAK